MTDMEKLATVLHEMGVQFERGPDYIEIPHPEEGAGSFAGYAGIFEFNSDGSSAGFRVAA